MTAAKVPNVWDKLAGWPQAPATTSTPESEEEVPRRFKRLRGILLDLTSTVVWLYVFVKLFVGDVDRWLIARMAPGLTWLLDLRFFFLLLLLSIFVMFVRRRGRWIPVYVLAFPLIVLVWKIPRFLYKRQSWLLTIGVVHVLLSMIRGVKFTIVSATVAAFAMLVIVATDWRVPLIVASLALGLLWVAVLYRAFRYAFTPSRFVRSQRRMVEKILDSGNFWTAGVAIDASVRDPSKTVLTPEETNAFLTKVGSGVIAYRFSQFWAYKLDSYRRSGAFIVFSALSMIALVLQAVITFAFINYSLFKIDPSQYAGKSSPSLPLFAYYSFSSLYVNEIGALAPNGTWAFLIQIFAGFSAGVLVIMLGVTLVFGFKQSRTDESATRSIAEMRRKGDEFAVRLAQEYELSLDDLLRRMSELGWDMLGVLAYLSKEIPTAPVGSDGGPKGAS